MRDLVSRLRSLKYFATLALPDLAGEFTMLDLSSQHGTQAAADLFGISVERQLPGNRLFIHRRARRVPYSTRFLFYGGHNTIVIDQECSYHGTMSFAAEDNLVVLMGGQGELSLDATLYNGDTLITGKGATLWGVRVWVQGGTVCTISDGCLMSENITIRTTDHHSVIDLATWEQINKPADVTIGRHVWVGPSCRINKGVAIGDGAILAADSVLTVSMPKAEFWGGAPARMIRKNISWVRSHPIADRGEIAALRELFSRENRE
jgi:carbonic anhydrase/acetyltransferase-like protein (isoleucine patch superfamily)